MSAAQSGRMTLFLSEHTNVDFLFYKELLTVNELLVESGRVMFEKMKSRTHCLRILFTPNIKWTTTLEIVNPMFYPSVPPHSLTHSLLRLTS